MSDPYASTDALPCSECPAQLLDAYLASPGGRRIGQTIDLDFALQAGVTVSLKDILYPEFLLLRFLNEERHRFHAEESQKASERHAR